MVELVQDVLWIRTEAPGITDQDMLARSLKNRLDRSADGGTIANCLKKGVDFRQAAAQW